MLDARWSRAVAVLVLLGLLFGLTVWFGSLEPDPAVGALPGANELGTDYDRYVGERVSVWGRVVRTDPVVVTAHAGVDRTLRLRVVGLDPSVTVAEGTRLHVYGVVEPDDTVRIVDAVRIPARGVAYTLSISFLAGLWVLGRLVRYWRVEVGALALRRRERPVRVSSWLRSTAGVDDDA